MNRTTTLIPFLQAIKHFCYFIPSYFMERFAFLIDGTSYKKFQDDLGILKVLYWYTRIYKESVFDKLTDVQWMDGRRATLLKTEKVYKFFHHKRKIISMHNWPSQTFFSSSQQIPKRKHLLRWNYFKYVLSIFFITLTYKCSHPNINLVI